MLSADERPNHQLSREACLVRHQASHQDWQKDAQNREKWQKSFPDFERAVFGRNHPHHLGDTQNREEAGSARDTPESPHTYHPAIPRGGKHVCQGRKRSCSRREERAQKHPRTRGTRGETRESGTRRRTREGHPKATPKTDQSREAWERPWNYPFLV